MHCAGYLIEELKLGIMTQRKRVSGSERTALALARLRRRLVWSLCWRAPGGWVDRASCRLSSGHTSRYECVWLRRRRDGQLKPGVAGLETWPAAWDAGRSSTKVWASSTPADRLLKQLRRTRSGRDITPAQHCVRLTGVGRRRCRAVHHPGPRRPQVLVQPCSKTYRRRSVTDYPTTRCLFRARVLGSDPGAVPSLTGCSHGPQD